MPPTTPLYYNKNCDTKWLGRWDDLNIQGLRTTLCIQGKVTTGNSQRLPLQGTAVPCSGRRRWGSRSGPRRRGIRHLSVGRLWSHESRSLQRATFSHSPAIKWSVFHGHDHAYIRRMGLMQSLRSRQLGPQYLSIMENYCQNDEYVWCASLGPERSNIFTVSNYCSLPLARAWPIVCRYLYSTSRSISQIEMLLNVFQLQEKSKA